MKKKILLLLVVLIVVALGGCRPAPNGSLQATINVEGGESHVFMGYNNLADATNNPYTFQLPSPNASWTIQLSCLDCGFDVYNTYTGPQAKTFFCNCTHPSAIVVKASTKEADEKKEKEASEQKEKNEAARKAAEEAARKAAEATAG